MMIERIHTLDSGLYQQTAEKLERDRKKTHTDQAISFEDKRSENQQQPQQDQEQPVEKELLPQDLAEADSRIGVVPDANEVSRVNVVV